MAGGTPEGDTADNELLLEDHRDGHPVAPYRALWAVLLLGWVVSYADRTVTGPVIAWMIETESGFIGDASNPATVGGLVGSMFFLGYMLTQYPGGRLGDRFGHREMIIVSLLAAAVLTVVSGLMTGLVAFVAARVLTGLGEGVFYSNDRTLIINHTPVAKRTLGLGVVITGLSIGLTLGIVLTPVLIDWGGALGMGDGAWRVPFFVFAAATFVVVTIAFVFFRARLGGPMRLGAPFVQLAAFSAPTFVVIVALFLLADTLEWPEWLTATIASVIALVYIAVIVRGVQRSGRGAALLNRNMWLIYVAYIAILWNLWFFSFWSVQIVREAAESSLIAAALTAAFNAGAGILGFPVGGWLADRAIRTGRGRKPLALVCTGVYSVLVLVFGWSISGGREPSLLLLGVLLFSSGVFFNALQPIVQGMTGDLVPAGERGAAFGMLNLVSEIGAVLSPVVSGILRDATGSWATGVYVAAGIMIVSFFLYAFVREAPAHHEDPIPA
ncbi:MFS transporter [Geodermatophilus sabuli]|uniref:Sugar phosphate permease n=1 Tax=Geodermatophilus sabuli TaxID=1564158 RepID=A0A285EI28_9ACTN|nr:MFS transporter [Geodermatophilus sabuli]MBB3083872.1 MFS family permease [Geodermatophilus sabuli]SNX98523.1 Sugar phosphate permease [Geodermatophilus sabuli]